ncbi:tyrosine-type recombinase/integrase [Streptomyces sp. AB3(2024)]|uniref:tyrosine-type recombinase/integrase n=1 Tax=Streptomyces sp. AB3(2024) TaxID=3317321 RepID=UPI0035A37E27
MRLGPSQHQDPPCPITADRRRNAMRPVLTLRLASFDDSQHAVLLIYMLHQFAHGGTISVPTDSEAPGTRKRVTCITGGPAEYNTADHLRRESRLCDRTCSIATRSHPHAASADTRHACATHNYEAGMPLWDVQVLLGHVWASTTVGYLATAKGDPERASPESSRRAVRRLSTDA